MWGKRINYFSLILLIGFGLLFYNHYLLMLLLVTLIVLPLISFVVTKISKNKIELDIKLKQTSVGKNKPIDVCFAVKNNSLIPFENLTVMVKVLNTIYGNDDIYNIVIPAVPRDTREVQLNIIGKYCGRIELDCKTIILEDFLGLFKFKVTTNISRDIFVMPDKYIELPQINLSTTGVSRDDEVQYKKGDDVSQISQIRDYIPGDRLQNIHWKLSSKKEELQVKEFSLPYSDKVTLLLEFCISERNPEYTDEIIETYYGVASYLVKLGRKFNVAWYNTNISELFTMTVETETELCSSVYELFYSKPSKQTIAYNYYRSINSNTGNVVVYIAPKEMSKIEGKKLEIEGKGVQVVCLS